MTSATTQTVSLAPDLSVTVREEGTGRPVLLLHGGGGPATVVGIAEHLAPTMHTIAPTHPGWNGTPRSAEISGIPDLAQVYLRYLQDRDLTDVLVIGSSIGGWTAAEMATHDAAGRITGLILIDAVGIEVPGIPILDIFALDGRTVAEHTFYNADRFYVDPATLPPDRAAIQKGNMAALRAIAGDPYMHDPDLLAALPRIKIPVLVIWGESDRLAPLAYGAAYAAAIPNARFEVVKQAGHVPHMEQPAAVLALIDTFLNEHKEQR